MPNQDFSKFFGEPSNNISYKPLNPNDNLLDTKSKPVLGNEPSFGKEELFAGERLMPIFLQPSTVLSGAERLGTAAKAGYSTLKGGIERIGGGLGKVAGAFGSDTFIPEYGNQPLRKMQEPGERELANRVQEFGRGLTQTIGGVGEMALTPISAELGFFEPEIKGAIEKGIEYTPESAKEFLKEKWDLIPADVKAQGEDALLSLGVFEIPKTIATTKKGLNLLKQPLKRSLDAKKLKFAEQITRQKLTKGELMNAAKDNKIRETVFGERNMVPSAHDQAIAATVANIDKVKPGIFSKNLIKNNNRISDTIKNTAKKVDADLGVRGGIFPERQFNAEVAKFLARDRDMLFAGQKSLENAYKSVVETFRKTFRKYPNTAKGLNDARKEFDRLVEQTTAKASGKSLFDLDPITNIKATAVRDLRSFVKDFVIKNAKGTNYADDMKKMFLLFEAQERMAPFIAGQSPTVLGRLIQKGRALSSGEVLTLGALLGSSAIFAPLPTVLAAGAYGAYKVGAAGVRSAGQGLYNLLSKIPPTTSNIPAIGQVAETGIAATRMEGLPKIISEAASKTSEIPGANILKKSKDAFNKLKDDTRGVVRFFDDLDGSPTKETSNILRGTRGMTADDIMAKFPDIKLKKDIPAKDVYGNKVKIPEGEVLTPYELKGNKVLLQDGETYVVSKNQYANIKGNSISSEVKPFAPEFEGLDETVMGGDDAIQIKIDKLKNEYSNTKDISKQKQIKASIDKLSEGINKETKYKPYTLPGGENYKEILIQAPSKRSLSKVINKEGKWYIESQDGSLSMPFKDEKSAQSLLADSIDRQAEGGYSSENLFKSSHFDEPNIIAHLRLNERTYKGDKVTFMEEAQSDWANAGREKGFQSPERTARRAELEAQLDEIIKKQNVTPEGDIFDRLEDRRKALVRERNQGGIFSDDGIPNNPNLKNWQELAIKRALQEAVENDSKYFSWITGKQTSARYNLSKQLDDVSWQKMGEEKMITMNPIDSEASIRVFIDAKGKVTRTGGQADESWTGKSLDEVVGKGMADSIMSKETGTLEGEGLKFGGEWANNLYDRQVKNIVEDLTGAKVEKIDLGLSSTGKPTERWISKKNILALNERNLEVGKVISDKLTAGEDWVITKVLRYGKFEAVPKKRYDEIKELPYSDWKIAKELESYIKEFDVGLAKSQQQSIKLTPEIKAKIKGEAPSFKASGTLYEKPTLPSPISSIKNTNTSPEEMIPKILTNIA